jgi:hypothetical protein
MGTADKEVARTERTDDLRRARDERYCAFGLNIGQLAQMLLSRRGTHQRLSGNAYT